MARANNQVETTFSVPAIEEVSLTNAVGKASDYFEEQFPEAVLEDVEVNINRAGSGKVGYKMNMCGSYQDRNI